MKGRKKKRNTGWIFIMDQDTEDPSVTKADMPPGLMELTDW